MERPRVNAPAAHTPGPERRHWPAIVIGAGPAGAACAIRLAREGVHVLLLDRACFPREKACGGCLNARAIAQLDALGLTNPVARFGAPALTRLELVVRGHTHALPLGASVAVSRATLDAALVDIARGNGVRVLQGVRAGVGAMTEYGRAVRCEEAAGVRTLTADVVIVATGLSGRALPVDVCGPLVAKPGSRVGVAATIDAAYEPPPGVVRMCVARGGYVGLARQEGARLDIAGAVDPAFLRAHNGTPDAVRALLKEAGVPAPEGLDHARWRGVPHLTCRRAHAAAPGVFVAGDARGYVEPFTGEGVAWALDDAAALAPIALAAVREGWSAAHAHAWEACIRRRRGAKSLSALLARALRSPAAADALGAIVSRVPGVAGPVLRLAGRAPPRGHTPPEVSPA
ncbi:MAG: FAD-dependent oxidoreductase [Phycisphaerales bacterium]|nr:MAG: FAD-dependent oxidoreductase [Phycisphaerales bacterium]